MLFTLFTAPLGEVCRKNRINFQAYACADDQQSYLSFKPSDTNSIAKCKQSLVACIKDIRKWMRTNKLKLNDEKMEGEDNTFEIKIDSEVIKPTSSARNLSFHLEAQLKSQTHITKEI